MVDQADRFTHRLDFFHAVRGEDHGRALARCSTIRSFSSRELIGFRPLNGSSRTTSSGS